MSTAVVIPDNLGDEFDLGNIEPSKIRLKLGTGLSRDVSGVISAVGDLTYVHTQIASVTVWTIVHNLGKRPSVSQTDSAGEPIEGNVEHVSLNELTITHYFPTDGTAILN